VTSSWFFLSTLNYDARSTTHQNILLLFDGFFFSFCLFSYNGVVSGSLRSVVRAWRCGNLYSIPIYPELLVTFLSLSFTVHSVVCLINTPTNAHIFIYLTRIHIKTLKTLLHVSIIRSSSGRIHCSLLKL
jgi:hypothetical protein